MQWWDILSKCLGGGLKANSGKSKVMLLGGEEGLECEVCIDKVKFRACLRI